MYDGVVESFQINSTNSTHALLIATQGSEYKIEVTLKIINALQTENLFINVVDVTSLDLERIDDYDAVVIIYTVEIWETPKQAIEFVNRSEVNQVFGIATLGDGSYHMDGVDGITCASPLIDSGRHAEKAVQWIKKKLAIIK